MESGGELCLGDGLTFSGNVTRQWQEAGHDEWVYSETAPVMPATAKVGFGNIGARLTVGGKGFYAKFRNKRRPHKFPCGVRRRYAKYRIVLFFQQLQQRNQKHQPASLPKNAYYVVAFNGTGYARPINFVELENGAPKTTGSFAVWQGLSDAVKKPFMWTLQEYPGGGGYYLKNVGNGSVLDSTGDVLKSVNYFTPRKIWVEGKWQSESWALEFQGLGHLPYGSYILSAALAR